MIGGRTLIDSECDDCTFCIISCTCSVRGCSQETVADCGTNESFGLFIPEFKMSESAALSDVRL